MNVFAKNTLDKCMCKLILQGKIALLFETILTDA